MSSGPPVGAVVAPPTKKYLRKSRQSGTQTSVVPPESQQPVTVDPVVPISPVREDPDVSQRESEGDPPRRDLATMLGVMSENIKESYEKLDHKMEHVLLNVQSI